MMRERKQLRTAIIVGSAEFSPFHHCFRAAADCPDWLLLCVGAAVTMRRGGWPQKKIRKLTH